MHIPHDSMADVFVTCIWIVGAGAIFRLIFLAWDELTGKRTYQPPLDPNDIQFSLTKREDA